MKLCFRLQLFFLCCVLCSMLSCKKHSHTLKTTAATVVEKPKPTISPPKWQANRVTLPTKKEEPPKRSSTQELPTAKAYPKIEALSGMESKQISKLLGKPDFMRYDPPAMYWQYKLSNCTLDFYLYPDSLNRDIHRVSFFQSRGGPTLRSCFATAIGRNKG